MTPAKKELHADLSKMLEARRLNPERSGKLAKRMAEEVEDAQARMRRPKTAITGPSAVEAFNALGKLNKLIGEGRTELIPLRDTLKASIEGYLTPTQSSRALEEALRDLTSTEVKLLRREFNKAYSVHRAVGFSRARADVLRRQVKQHPEVRAKRSKVQRLQRLVEREREADKSAALKRKFSYSPYGKIRYTKKELADQECADLQADQELGRIKSFEPASPSIWEKARKMLEEKHGGKYIKPKLKSLKMFEADLRGFAKSPTKYKAKTFQGQLYRHKVIKNLKGKSAANKLASAAEKRLSKMQANRFKSAAIKLYEKLGGEEYIGPTVSKSGFKNLGQPFKLDGGFYAVITAHKGGYIWSLIDSPDPPPRILMKGKSKDTQSASRKVKVAGRIAYELYKSAQAVGDTGWDYLKERDRRWLSENRGSMKIDEGMARMVLSSIDKYSIDEDTARWLAKSANVKALKPVEIRRASPFKGMTTGEERTMKGPKNAYTVFVKKTMNGYRVTVQTKEGKEQSFFTKNMSEVKTKAAVLGGLMTGAEEVAKAVSNPTKIRRLANSADRFFKKRSPKSNRKKNPKMGKSSVADIKSLEALFDLPDDPEEAAEIGFYFGIIRGLDTCGVQNYFERQRIRKKFNEKILSGAFQTASKALKVKGGDGGSRRYYQGRPLRVREEPDEEPDIEDMEDYV